MLNVEVTGSRDGMHPYLFAAVPTGGSAPAAAATAAADGIVMLFHVSEALIVFRDLRYSLPAQHEFSFSLQQQRSACARTTLFGALFKTN